MKVRSIESLGDYLRDQRRNAELSLRQLAERAGVSNPYLSQVERGLRKPSAEVLSQLAKALQISAEAVYVRAGLLDPDEEGATRSDVKAAVDTAIRADPLLTERHKRVLLDIYDSFRRESEQARGDGAQGATEGAGQQGPASQRASQKGQRGKHPHGTGRTSESSKGPVRP